MARARGEFWSLRGLEEFYNLLPNSESPNLPVAKAMWSTIKVTLIYIPVRSAGGGLQALEPQAEESVVDDVARVCPV